HALTAWREPYPHTRANSLSRCPRYRTGVPFRDAHEATGKAVRYCIDKHCDLDTLDLSVLKKISPAIEKDVYTVLTLQGSVEARCHLGGTAPEQVREASKRARMRL
ncbi:MAG: hypothetical protein GY862_34765, partial [Gammaproteobacteria bacterium]|nr:hypothetical protein [Gammaproteobacteria bacterium]